MCCLTNQHPRLSKFDPDCSWQEFLAVVHKKFDPIRETHTNLHKLWSCMRNFPPNHICLWSFTSNYIWSRLESLSPSIRASLTRGPGLSSGPSPVPPRWSTPFSGLGRSRAARPSVNSRRTWRGGVRPGVKWFSGRDGPQFIFINFF